MITKEAAYGLGQQIAIKEAGKLYEFPVDPRTGARLWVNVLSKLGEGHPELPKIIAENSLLRGTPVGAIMGVTSGIEEGHHPIVSGLGGVTGGTLGAIVGSLPAAAMIIKRKRGVLPTAIAGNTIGALLGGYLGGKYTPST